VSGSDPIHLREAIPKKTRIKLTQTAEPLDEIFDQGQKPSLPYLDFAKAVHPDHQARAILIFHLG
jgi:hypothetical protein